jgi:DNA-binding TFAR19-related protein (PDSD5 family)
MEDAAAQDAMREEAIVRLKEQEKRARIAEVRLVLRELNRYAEVELEGMEMATGGRA